MAEEEVYYNASNSVEVVHAQAELAKWKQYGVCTEVEDTGQPAITTRWVLTEKSVEVSEWSKQSLLCEVMKERHLRYELIHQLYAEKIYGLFLPLL